MARVNFIQKKLIKGISHANKNQTDFSSDAN